LLEVGQDDALQGASARSNANLDEPKNAPQLESEISDGL